MFLLYSESMTRDEYKIKVDELVQKINQSRERLWQSVKSEDYKSAATLRDKIKVDKEKLMKLLSEPVPNQQ